MINTFEHVNKALRFKYNTNMSRAEYNKTVDNLVTKMNNTLNNFTSLAKKMDEASKTKMFWKKYFK